eukprot:4650829-Pleurochrysis_carterae.AAC.1
MPGKGGSVGAYGLRLYRSLALRLYRDRLEQKQSLGRSVLIFRLKIAREICEFVRDLARLTYCTGGPRGDAGSYREKRAAAGTQAEPTASVAS